MKTVLRLTILSSIALPSIALANANKATVPPLGPKHLEKRIEYKKANSSSESLGAANGENEGDIRIKYTKGLGQSNANDEQINH